MIADYLRTHGDDAIGGVVLVGIAPQLGTEEAQGDLGPEFLETVPGVLSRDVEVRIESTRRFVDLLTEDPLTEKARDTALATTIMMPPEVGGAMFGRQLDNTAVLADIDVPTLVVHGEKDRIVLRSAAEHVAEIVPRAELEIYEGVGHAVSLESPERFARDVAVFVRRIRPGGVE